MPSSRWPPTIVTETGTNGHVSAILLGFSSSYPLPSKPQRLSYEDVTICVNSPALEVRQITADAERHGQLRAAQWSIGTSVTRDLRIWHGSSEIKDTRRSRPFEAALIAAKTKQIEAGDTFVHTKLPPKIARCNLIKTIVVNFNVGRQFPEIQPFLRRRVRQ